MTDLTNSPSQDSPSESAPVETRGGYREGAGRKKGEPKQLLAGYLTEPTYAKFMEFADGRKTEALETIISEYFDENGPRQQLARLRQALALVLQNAQSATTSNPPQS